MNSVYFGGYNLIDVTEKFLSYLKSHGDYMHVEDVNINHHYNDDGEGRITGEEWDISLYYEDK